MRFYAQQSGVHTIRIEAPENKSLPALLAPQLRRALLRLNHPDAAKSLAAKGRRALAGFANALKINYEDIEVGLDFEPEAGPADNRDLAAEPGDLPIALENRGSSQSRSVPCSARIAFASRYPCKINTAAT